MPQITQANQQWQITGSILVENANTLLLESKQLTLEQDGKIDFAAVEDVDTAALSLILEWKRRAIAENKQITLLNLPSNLKSLSQLYGLADLIH